MRAIAEMRPMTLTEPRIRYRMSPLRILYFVKLTFNVKHFLSSVYCNKIAQERTYLNRFSSTLTFPAVELLLFLNGKPLLYFRSIQVPGAYQTTFYEIQITDWEAYRQYSLKRWERLQTVTGTQLRVADGPSGVALRTGGTLQEGYRIVPITPER